MHLTLANPARLTKHQVIGSQIHRDPLGMWRHTPSPAFLILLFSRDLPPCGRKSGQPAQVTGRSSHVNQHCENTAVFTYKQASNPSEGIWSISTCYWEIQTTHRGTFGRPLLCKILSCKESMWQKLTQENVYAAHQSKRSSPERNK